MPSVVKSALSMKAVAPMSWEQMEAEFEEDLDKMAGIGFHPINYQCISEDEHYKQQLVITLLLLNGIRNLEVHPNIDGKKLIIPGLATQYSPRSLLLSSSTTKSAGYNTPIDDWF
jgi:hypothetical protein